MKKLLFAFVLLPVIAFGQLNKDSIIWEAKDYGSMNIFVGSIIPKHKIAISGENNKQLYLDFKNDSLTVSGDLEMDAAAIKFINFVKQQYPREIFRLNADSTEIIFNGNKYIKALKQNKN